MTDKTENDLNDIQKNDTPPIETADDESDKKKSSILSELSSSATLKSTKKKNIKKFHHKKLTTPKIIPRHCLEKKDWLDLLATPRKRSTCLNENLAIKTIYYYQLSQPTRKKIIAKLQNRTTKLSVPFADELIHISVNDDLSLEEVENLFQNTSKKKNKPKLKKIKCQNAMEPVQHNESLQMSEDAVLCQYNIAKAFVKSILQHKNVALRNDVEDLVNVIQKRLIKIVGNNENPNKDGKVYHQILFLSKLVANWIAGVLEEVAEQNEKELKKECEERRRRLEADVFDESDDDYYEEVLINTEKVDDGQEKNESNEKEELYSDETNNEQSADELINQNETETNTYDYDNTTDNITDNNDEEYEINNDQDNDDSNT